MSSSLQFIKWKLFFLIFLLKIEAVRPGLFDLTARLFGPCSILQAALPQILKGITADSITNYVANLQVIGTFAGITVILSIVI